MQLREDLGPLGLKIRAFRKMRKLTVRRLAELSTISASMISKVENGKASPGFATILKISAALDLSLGNLVTSNEATQQSLVIRKDERSLIKWGQASKKYLITPRSFQYFKAYEIELAPGDKIEDLTCIDTSILLVATSGQGTIQVNQNLFDLKEGETLTFTNAQTHGFFNHGSTQFRAIFVLGPQPTPIYGIETS